MLGKEATDFYFIIKGSKNYIYILELNTTEFRIHMIPWSTGDGCSWTTPRELLRCFCGAPGVLLGFSWVFLRCSWDALGVLEGAFGQALRAGTYFSNVWDSGYISLDEI